MFIGLCLYMPKWNQAVNLLIYFIDIFCDLLNDIKHFHGPFNGWIQSIVWLGHNLFNQIHMNI